MLLISMVSGLGKSFRLLLLFSVFSQNVPQIESENINKAPGVSSAPGKVPRKNNFHKEIIDYLHKLAKSVDFFKLALRHLQDKGYEFVLYEEDDLNIPRQVHEVMHGDRFNATTWKDLKKVYIMPTVLDTDDKESIPVLRRNLPGTLANEAVHVILDNLPKIGNPDDLEEPLDFEESKVVFEEMLASEGFTDSEKIYHEALNEEILSSFVEHIVTKKIKEPDFKISEGDLLKGKYSNVIQKVKEQLRYSVFCTMFDVTALGEDDVPKMESRIDRYLKSGEIERYLTQKLKEFGLVDN